MRLEEMLRRWLEAGLIFWCPWLLLLEQDAVDVNDKLRPGSHIEYSVEGIAESSNGRRTD